MTTVDAIVVVPVLPLLPILATWWLPWERWLKSVELPKMVIGSYLLHVSFAAWYFRFPWWVVMLLGGAGGTVLLTAVDEKYRK